MTHDQTRDVYKSFMVMTTIMPLFNQVKDILRKHKFLLNNVEVIVRLYWILVNNNGAFGV